jgi:hypothetical protein
LVFVVARARRPRDCPAGRRRYKNKPVGLRLVSRLIPSRRFDLQFEVNDQAYFLNFVEDEGLWYVFRPTGSGVIRIPVEMEAVHSEHFAFAPEEGKKRVVH